MLTLAEVEAAIAAADARRSRQIRHAHLDHEAAIAPWLKIRQPLIDAKRSAAAVAAGAGLTYAEIARVRPTGKATTPDAVKQDIYRAMKRERVEPGDRDGKPTLPPDWLRRQKIIT